MTTRETRYHHLINRIGAMSDSEKRLMTEYSGACGLTVPDLISLAWREYVISHANDIRQAISDRSVIEAIAV